jgi:transmembrane sensor
MKKDRAFYQDFDNAERVGYLIASFIKGTLSPLERKELDAWILASDKNEQLFDELTKEENIEKTMEWYAGINEEKAYQRIKKRIGFKPQKRKVVSVSFISVAASVLLIVGIAAFFLWQKNQEAGKDAHPVALSQDLPPGSNKAILTLTDGRKIILDSTAPKTISEGRIKIDAGVISYDTLVASPPKENLLTVPRGGQFMVVLADGTKVWLNAESSLKYVTSFVGNERRVVLTGEAYFEVAKNKEKPFIVESSGNTIKVLGTKFNVNSYKNEDVFTATLVEGSVQITKGTVSKILKPGQQASITENKIEVAETDVSENTAWKNGEFVFRNAPVHAIARQLARWYDLDVEYRDPAEKHLNATIKRNIPLSKLLQYLEETGDVHFKTEGKKLIVMK